MFPDSITRAVTAAATANDIEPAAMLALVEVETGGKAFEQDGRTPAFLYERHVAYKEADMRGFLAAFLRAGLANKGWQRATQYKDQRTSAQRLELIARAKAIDPETALRSASHGVGQVMGNNAEKLHYPSAVDMVARMNTVEGQLDALIRELRVAHIIAPLNAHEWDQVARLYNGSGYAANHYDTKLADAYKRWTRRLVTNDGRPPPPEQSLSRDEIRAIQGYLRDLGYAEVGRPDGLWGSRTVGAISAFQAHEGLPVTGHYDDATKAALAEAEARPVAKERETATADDLKKEGSRTIKEADDVSWWGRLKIWLGIGAVSAGGAEQGGLLGQAQDVADKAAAAKTLWSTAHDMLGPLLADPLIIGFGVVLVGVGFAVYIRAERAKAARVDDHRTGIHAGS